MCIHTCKFTDDEKAIHVTYFAQNVLSRLFNRIIPVIRK